MIANNGLPLLIYNNCINCTNKALVNIQFKEIIYLERFKIVFTFIEEHVTN